MAGMRVIGNANQLLAYHGDVDFSKAIATIKAATELTLIDISEINKASYLGGIYVTHDGHILDEWNEDCEKRAKYKLIPTGLFQKFSNKPLVASFIRQKTGWEGIYLGTVEKLFEYYAEAYRGSDEFDRSYVEYFCGENCMREINAFGLKALLNGPEEIEDDKSDGTITNSRYEQCLKALEKLNRQLNSGKRSRSEKAKIQKKIDTMTRELEKAKIAEGIVDEIDSSASNEDVPIEVNNIPLQEDTSEKTERLQEDNKDMGRKAKIETTESIENNAVVEDTVKEPIVSVEEVPAVVEEKPKRKRAPRKKKVEEPVVVDTPVETPVSVENNAVATVEITPVNTAKVYSGNVDPNHMVGSDSDEIADALTDSEAKNTQAICEEIYSKLLCKERWADNNFRRLSFYLKGILTLIDTRSSKTTNDYGDGYVFSPNRKKMLFNTNLLDTYGNFIYIIDHTPNTKLYFKKRLSIMQSKSGLIDEGFTLESVRKLPGTVKLLNNPKDFVFNGSIDDFDLADDEHLNHIINERRMRFPDNYRDCASNIICDKLKASIEQAIKINEIDYRYIVPMYNLKFDEVEFLIPFYLDKHFGERPELAIIITNKRGLWKIFTVLKIEDAYDNTRIACNVGNNWLI